MPVLLSQSEVRLEWSDVNNRVVKKKATKQTKRSAGVHLSGVIKHVLTTSGMLKTEDTDDEMPLRMAIGMAWEEWAVGLWIDMDWQPGECRLDGVAGSPDGITPLLGATIKNGSYIKGQEISVEPVACGKCLEEFKATWKSAHTHGDVLEEK